MGLFSVPHLKSHLKTIWQLKTIEPTLAIFYLITELLNFLDTNMLLQKKCRFNETVEPNLPSTCDHEKLAQEFVSEMNGYKFIVTSVLAVSFTMTASVWSDNHNRERRPMLFVPIVGQLLYSAFSCLNAYFWHWDPMIQVVMGALVQGLTGGKVCVILGSQLYISDITTAKNRSFRIGLIVSLYFICLPFGAGISGYLNTSFGFVGGFAFCFLLAAIALSTGLAWIEPSARTVDNGDPEKSKQVVAKSSAITPLSVLSSVSVIFKKRPQRKRAILICLLIIDALHIIPMSGEQTVTYLYFRYRFGWHEKAYSVYTAYKMLGTLVGTMFCTVYMSKHLKIHDGFIGTLAAFWDTVGNISYFFADQAWELYVIPLYNIFNGVLFAMMASLATKCVEPNEMGYLTSVRSLMQIVSPLSFPLYGLVYKSTLDKLPNAFFLLSVGFNFPTIILFGIAYYLSKDIEFETASPDTLQSPTTVNNSVADSAWKKPEQKNQLSIS